MMFRPLPVMTVCVIISLGILAMLGQWQWQRFSEKSARAGAPIDWVELDAGTVVEDGIFYKSTIFSGRAAWYELMAVDTGHETVLVNAGVVFSIEAPDDPLNKLGDEAPDFGEGIFRTPSAPSAFTPPSDIDKHVIFAIDYDALERALGRPLLRQVFEPRVLRARDETGDAVIDNPQANPVLADPLPPARHLGYAFTWWGIGAGLFIIYLIFHVKAGRLTFGRQT